MKIALIALTIITFSFVSNANDNLIGNVPKEWSKETFTFPLRFAPSIELKGLEEVHFAPGMFKPESPDYFNYVFLWHLEDKQQFSKTEYENLLLAYYKGLYLAVSKATDEVKKQNLESFSFQLHTTQIGQHKVKGEWLDAFNNDNPIELSIHIESAFCASQNKTNILFRITSKDKASAKQQLDALSLPNCP